MGMVALMPGTHKPSPKPNRGTETMTTPSSISRRNFFRSIVAPALAVAVVATAAGTTLNATAEAGTP
jgi:anti-sigma-K factor RskA